MIIDYILAAVALIWLVVASVSDIKRREVANWLSFSLLAIALGLRAIGAITMKQPPYFLYSILIFAIFYAISELFYQTKIFAGGDAKLLVALSVVFATQPSFSEPFRILSLEFPFIAVLFYNILFVGSLFGIAYSIVLAITNRKKFIREFSKLEKTNRKKICLFEVIMLILIFLFFITGIVSILILYVLGFIYPFLYIFVKAIENACMIKLVFPKELTEGDWLVNAVKIGRKIIKPTADGLSMSEIRMIRKANKKVLIKQGIPFVPVFLIAVIVSLLNVLGFIVSLII